MIEQKIVELSFSEYTSYANEEIERDINKYRRDGWIIKQISPSGNSSNRLFLLLERNVDNNVNTI